jgi:hypothetical protein
MINEQFSGQTQAVASPAQGQAQAGQGSAIGASMSSGFNYLSKMMGPQ